MPIAQSKLTAQGQVSIPAKVRQKLGIGPGSVVEWDERNEEVVVRRAGKHSSEEIHAALFPKGPPKSSTPTADGIRAYVRRKHARG